MIKTIRQKLTNNKTLRLFILKSNQREYIDELFSHSATEQLPNFRGHVIITCKSSQLSGNGPHLCASLRSAKGHLSSTMTMAGLAAFVGLAGCGLI